MSKKLHPHLKNKEVTHLAWQRQHKGAGDIIMQSINSSLPILPGEAHKLGTSPEKYSFIPPPPQ